MPFPKDHIWIIPNPDEKRINQLESHRCIWIKKKKQQEKMIRPEALMAYKTNAAVFELPHEISKLKHLKS